MEVVRPDYYELLGVTPEARESIIRAVYRAWMKEVHPDTGVSGDELAKEINAAYEVLSDPFRRAEYDNYLATRSTVSETGTDEGFSPAQSSREDLFSQEDSFEYGGSAEPPEESASHLYAYPNRSLVVWFVLACLFSLGWLASILFNFSGVQGGLAKFTLLYGGIAPIFWGLFRAELEYDSIIDSIIEVFKIVFFALVSSVAVVVVLVFVAAVFFELSDETTLFLYTGLVSFLVSLVVITWREHSL